MCVCVCVCLCVCACACALKPCGSYIVPWVKSFALAALDYVEGLADVFGLGTLLADILQPIRDQLDSIDYAMMQEYCMQVTVQSKNRCGARVLPCVSYGVGGGAGKRKCWVVSNGCRVAETAVWVECGAVWFAALGFRLRRAGRGAVCMCVCANFCWFARQALYAREIDGLKSAMVLFSNDIGNALGYNFPVSVTAPVATALEGTKFIRLFLDQVRHWCLCRSVPNVLGGMCSLHVKSTCVGSTCCWSCGVSCFGLVVCLVCCCVGRVVVYRSLAPWCSCWF